MTLSCAPLIATLKKLFPLSCHDRVFLVGGCLRDILLERNSHDIDLAGALSSTELLECGFQLITGKSTAPIWFRHDPALGIIELTPLPDTAALTGDLARRDFTVNSIAMNLDEKIIDPQNGRRDLEPRLLRSNTPDTFRDDPLRIFRALRFEAAGWRMTAAAETLIRSVNWSGALRAVPVERFSHEMLSALQSPQPERFFQRMLELDVGICFLPELFRLPAIPAGPPIHHPEGDLFSHSCQVLQRVSLRTDSPLARFCAFFHDIGKLATDPGHYPKHHGHDQAGFGSARQLCDRLHLPANYRDALAWTSRLHGTLNRWDELRDATRLRIAGQALKAGIDGILPLVSAADKTDNRGHDGWLEALRICRLTTAELGIAPSRLEEIPAAKRSDYILQRRVELFRNK